ncbi:platelet-activating factor acetylhydrolase, isoform II domain-containing protein [Pochonia chlamydosporia 170]|uniref:1-alkyl-2-acetylglycerophosphocholine esterase n=1 Tax=Pochonia chlamydosporia 170 TaxID=1380566 RepID=A0A179FNM1_METCM|nr:platelet-activating factor acetylhydrolase, isoform II domain-containing protein [Pochonia chlamydosporia 170]OAQ67255.1 platelet-activating factor acetylhydrolase, isoform II domain-containing protein [Pochonia chlamydosporia 170]
MPKLIIIVAAVAAVQAVLFPLPPGPYGVGLRIQDYTDNKRLDPYAPKGQSHYRRVVISAFLPVEKEKCQTEAVPYMPPLTAAQGDGQLVGTGFANDSLSSAKMQVCKLSLVEFPDGSVIKNTTFELNPTVFAQAANVRADDASFILDMLHNPYTLAKLTAGLYGQVDPERILMYGHSLGGVTASKAMFQDKRIKAGMNVDGWMYEPTVVSTGLDRPFLLLGTPKQYDELDSNWPEFYEEWKPKMYEMFGSIDALPLQTITNEVLSGLADVAFNRNDTKLRNMEKFPEVSIEHQDFPKGR